MESPEALSVKGVAVIKETCVASLNPKICLGTSITGGGRGLYAKEKIAKGEWVWKEVDGFESIQRDWAFIEALPESARRAYLHFTYYVGHDRFSSLPEFDRLDPSEWHTVPSSDDSMYMNHSCDPTCWFVYPGGEVTESCDLMVATRDINPGDEITFDYGTSEVYPQWHAFECKCGAVDCRGQLSPHDWRKASMQRKYAGHFLWPATEYIAKHHTTDLYDLTVTMKDEGVKTLHTGKDIPAGEFVMVVPPNKLVAGDSVVPGTVAFKVGDNRFSVPLFEDDLSNFLKNSPDANLVATVRDDMAVELFAARDIVAGEALSVNLSAAVSSA